MEKMVKNHYKNASVLLPTFVLVVYCVWQWNTTICKVPGKIQNGSKTKLTLTQGLDNTV